MPLLGPGDHVGLASEDRGHQRGDIRREILQVGGIEDEDVAARHVTRRAEGVGDATLDPVLHNPQERIALGELLEHLGTVVAAAIVDDDHLAGDRRAAQGLIAEAGELRQVLDLVLGRH